MSEAARQLVLVADGPRTWGSTIPERNANYDAMSPLCNERFRVAADAYLEARGLLDGDLVEIVDPKAARVPASASGWGPLVIGPRGGLAVTVDLSPPGRPGTRMQDFPVQRDNVTIRGSNLLQLAHKELAAAGEHVDRPALVVPCGAAKLDRRAPASELYVGSLHRLSFRAAERLAFELHGEVMILSALHGLVGPAKVLDPYDVTIGDPDAITLDALGVQVAERRLSHRRTIVLGGSKYVQLLADTGVDVEAPLRGCAGMGYMNGRLAEITKTGQLAA